MAERLAILASGGGSTAREIILAQQLGKISNLEIGCVLSNNPEAGAFEKARSLRIPENKLVSIEAGKYRNDAGRLDPEALGEDLLRIFSYHRITFFIQCGYLLRTGENVIQEYPNRGFNQHPAPTPEFGGPKMFGKRPHAAFLTYKVLTGHPYGTLAVCQRVHPEFDQGAIINFREVPASTSDTVEELQQRVLPVEHLVQVDTLAKFTTGRLTEIPSPRYVRTDQIPYLQTAKAKAIRDYPKG